MGRAELGPANPDLRIGVYEDAEAADVAEVLAREFHNTLERLAPKYDTEGVRWRQMVPWERLSEDSRALLTAVQRDLLDRGVIEGL